MRYFKKNSATKENRKNHSTIGSAPLGIEPNKKLNTSANTKTPDMRLYWYLHIPGMYIRSTVYMIVMLDLKQQQPETDYHTASPPRILDFRIQM